MKYSLQTLFNYFACESLTIRKILTTPENHPETEEPSFLILEQLYSPDGSLVDGKRLYIPYSLENSKSVNLLMEVVDLESQIISGLTKRVHLYNMLGVIDTTSPMEPKTLTVPFDLEVVNDYLSKTVRFIFKTLFNVESKRSRLETTLNTTEELMVAEHAQYDRQMVFDGKIIPITPENLRVDFVYKGYEFLMSGDIWWDETDDWFNAFEFQLTIKCYTDIRKVGGMDTTELVPLNDPSIILQTPDFICKNLTIDSNDIGELYTIGIIAKEDNIVDLGEAIATLEISKRDDVRIVFVTDVPEVSVREEYDLATELTKLFLVVPNTFQFEPEQDLNVFISSNKPLSDEIIKPQPLQFKVNLIPTEDTKEPTGDETPAEDITEEETPTETE